MKHILTNKGLCRKPPQCDQLWTPAQPPSPSVCSQKSRFTLWNVSSGILSVCLERHCSRLLRLFDEKYPTVARFQRRKMITSILCINSVKVKNLSGRKGKLGRGAKMMCSKYYLWYFLIPPARCTNVSSYGYFSSSYVYCSVPCWAFPGLVVRIWQDGLRDCCYKTCW